MKKFLEFVSKNPEVQEKLKAAKDNAEELCAIAASYGFDIREDDLDIEGELSLDELEAVAGGNCGCVLAGGGGGTDYRNGKTYGCACAMYGQGGDGSADDFNCFCVAGGEGLDHSQHF